MGLAWSALQVVSVGGVRREERAVSVAAVRYEADYELPKYSIGEVSERSGLTRDTLRWYERIGLMDYVGRDHTGQRRFSDRDLDWLTLIGKLRRTGMPVADMVRYAELVRQGDETFPQRLEMFRRTREDVLARIAELQQTVAVLDCKIALYEGDPTRDWRTVVTPNTREGKHA
ncbi:MerR family transcriptional regulator [Nocardia otitidiscaviarum]|uniref:MerR family transcriptional regulator n=1 Tax=Nocardia otitidiscaviarum TaxID=1823 RepID=A0A516NEW2_9NOCA|nr:MerR family transcriptional regulator [Nocardia otitidiscaviarum]MBF6240040.1 MerR family transcriptional regulator [Nocardia otitidiscaviarum]MBF6488782.1 MerR family transcriptional regulator [Nocardia otitidiscaviarum]QDP77443.1 MerR family transcriptional regulator [Nocardia otitidiscaviarum]